MNIDSDLRGTPTFIVTYAMLGLAVLSIFLAITSFKFDWPVEPNGALGIGAIGVSVGGGIGFAFLKRRHDEFKRLGPYIKKK